MQTCQAVWKLTSVGFLPLQHLPELGVHFARVCLALYVALSGFHYPLSGFLLPGPVSHLPDSSVLGVFPFRVLLPSKRWSLSRGASSLALGSAGPGRDTDESVDFRALFASKSRVLCFRYCTEDRTVTLLGFHISGAFSPPTRQALSSSFPLLHFLFMTSKTTTINPVL